MHYELALGRIDLARRESNVIDRGAQAQCDKCSIVRWLTMQAYRGTKAISRTSPKKSRQLTLVSRLLAVFSLGTALCACTPDLSCSGADVQAGLKQALDSVYAQSRTLSQVDLTIKDIVSVTKSDQGVNCKAVVHLDIEYLGIKKTADPIIPYTAERTDNRQVLVTVSQ